MEESSIFKNIDVIRAFKDEAYRAGLNLEAQSVLQPLLDQGELSEQELEDVSGGFIMRDTVIVRPTWVVAKPTIQSDSIR